MYETNGLKGAVVGDHVYIHGGEISQLIDGTPDPGFGPDYVPFSRQSKSRFMKIRF